MLWWRLQQLRSPEWKIRSHAAEKLGESNDPRAVAALVKTLEDKDPNVQMAAAGALGNIGDANALEPLLKALQDHDRGVRAAVVEALGKLRDGRVIDRLLPLLRDKDNEFRSTVARALESACGAKLNDAQRAACAGARMKWEEAASIGAPAIEPLLEALKETKTQIRLAAIHALEKIGHERAIVPLIALLNDQDTTIQEAACWALAAKGDERCVMPLLDLTRDSFVFSAASSALCRLVERVARNIPDADLVALTQLGEKNAPEEPVTAPANPSPSTPTIDFSSVIRPARQELIRRGRSSSATG
jgi:HEAT repeat protein